MALHGCARWPIYVALFAIPLTSAACGGGTDANPPLVILDTDPVDGGRVFLNQPILVTFSNPIDLSSVNLGSVAFTPTDAAGNALSESVTGTFRFFRDDNGIEDRRTVEFLPRTPTNDTFDNGGLKPGRFYHISFVGGARGPAVHDTTGNTIAADSAIHAITIRTVDGSTPQQLFRDTKFGGPRVVDWTAGPQDEASGTISLNRLGDLPVEVVIRFDQPLNPSSRNVPIGQSLDPAEFASRHRGRIFLEYDDPFAGNRWLPAAIDLPANDSTGAVVIVRPDGVLPNNAEVRIVVETTLEDIAGESNRNDPQYQRVIGSFRTEPAFESQFDAVNVEFASGGAAVLDPAAAFRDPVAEVEDGMLAATFDFEGADTVFDYKPTSKLVILNTNATQIQPSNGPPFPVIGGVFSFHDIEIREGVLVQGVGSNPLVFLATGKVVIDGELNVDGSTGVPSVTVCSAWVPSSGGSGVCGGGNGGRGSPNTGRSSPTGEDGFGPLQRTGGGGRGGVIACGSRNLRGGGGGGGGGATRGDPRFYGQTSAIIEGFGGAGNSPGGAPGVRVVTNLDDSDDFWGRQVDDAGRVIIGELAAPTGGSGGGGGGDVTGAASCNDAAQSTCDRKGGGGGGGAGVIVIKALGPIIVGPNGRVSASGGDGAGGEALGGCSNGGGGGGGSGGMVVLMSATRIELQTHGGRWTAPDWDSEFSVAADGGVGTNNNFSNPGRPMKYMGESQAHIGAANRGGHGGLGIVQLMVPPGDDSSDTTGTGQDDNVVVKTGEVTLTSAAKAGFLFDGDIRPNPVLLPVPFSRYSQAQTRWITTGVFAGDSGAEATTVRREVTLRRNNQGKLDEDRSRIIDKELGTSGPEYFFAGTDFEGDENQRGWLLTDPKDGLLLDKVVTSRTITGMHANAATVRGRPAHVVEISGDPLPTASEKGGWSYANYQARLERGTRRILDYRILGHTKTSLYLDAGSDPLPEAADRVTIVAKFVDVVTGVSGRLTAGLGPTYPITRDSVTKFYPKANVRIGFAFHKDPSHPELEQNGTIDQNRFPKRVGEFRYLLDLDNPTERELLRTMHLPFVKIRVRFNLNFDPDNPVNTPGKNPVGPRTERPRLRFLRLPYRF